MEYYDSCWRNKGLTYEPSSSNFILPVLSSDDQGHEELTSGSKHFVEIEFHPLIHIDIDFKLII